MVCLSSTLGLEKLATTLAQFVSTTNDFPGMNCQPAVHPYKRNRDFIRLNVKFPDGKSNVFCGHHQETVIRRINKTDLSPGQSELVITFWSDPSHVGKGFFGIVRGH
jgi:hypothetical protein